MGIIYNLFMSVLHLIFIVIDVLLLAVLLKLICARWKVPVLRQLSDLLEPLTGKALEEFRKLISTFCPRSFCESVLLKLLLVVLCALRFVIIAVAT